MRHEIERLQVYNAAMRAEIEKLQTDKAAISQTASNYLHEIERLRAALQTIAEHRDIHSDFPHDLDSIQLYAKEMLI